MSAFQLTDAKQLDWEAVGKAAKTILKQVDDVWFTPPEALDILAMRAGRVAEQLGAIAQALKLTNEFKVRAEQAELALAKHETVVELVKTAIAGQCSCYQGGCVHDQVREAVGDPAALRARIAELEANAVRMREARFALEGIPTDGNGNPLCERPLNPNVDDSRCRKAFRHEGDCE
jgi:hypothetical protein